MTPPRKKPNIPPLTDDEAQRLVKIVEERTTEYVGNFDELEKAIGMLMIGRLVGWKVLALIHNRRTILKYEQILGIKIKDEFDPEGPLTHKSVAYDLVKKLDNFWKAVSGEASVENRRALVR
ncbi:MAG: hypothetical protein Q8S20_06275 [Sulfuritalea sp.]|nr:hypothetical protein [Sulfuritalea sp.]